MAPTLYGRDRLSFTEKYRIYIVRVDASMHSSAASRPQKCPNQGTTASADPERSSNPLATVIHKGAGSSIHRNAVQTPGHPPNLICLTFKKLV